MIDYKTALKNMEEIVDFVKLDKETRKILEKNGFEKITGEIFFALMTETFDKPIEDTFSTRKAMIKFLHPFKAEFVDNKSIVVTFKRKSYEFKLSFNLDDYQNYYNEKSYDVFHNYNSVFFRLEVQKENAKIDKPSKFKRDFSSNMKKSHVNIKDTHYVGVIDVIRKSLYNHPVYINERTLDIPEKQQNKDL